jgi:hypothetical protein
MKSNDCKILVMTQIKIQSPPKKKFDCSQKKCCPTDDGSISTIEPMTKKNAIIMQHFLWLPKKFGHQIM